MDDGFDYYPTECTYDHPNTHADIHEGEVTLVCKIETFSAPIADGGRRVDVEETYECDACGAVWTA